jgi:hypothetical protein
MSNEEKLAWFGGNTDALNLFHHLVELIHIWDDLIDKDKPVAYMSIVCLGHEAAKKFLPEIWKTIVDDRFDDYRKEHLNVIR